MGDKITYGIVTLIGILLVLPLINVNQLSGAITNWLTGLGVLAIGILGLVNK